ncbi:MAG: hypothetical protein K2G04_03975 [Oscillospiraceae bacterium]|nr:hypothetical protein [Oscillospiraceae bacterium]
MTVIYSELSPDEARVREQFLIATYGLENLKSDKGGNKRKEIASPNVGLDRYSDAITDLCALYGGYIEDEIIEYMRGNY